MEQDRDKNISQANLIDILRSLLLREDVSDKTVLSLLHHLADLDFLTRKEDGDWQFVSPTSDAPDTDENWVDRVKHICGQPEGFSLKYFVRDLPETVSLEWDGPGYEGFLSNGLLEGEGRSVPKQSSNLSNLQIVKKVGRQLSPLIEMENYFIEKLQGSLTTRQDARILFNYIIGRVRMKGEPREWTQLSRRRHK